MTVTMDPTTEGLLGEVKRATEEMSKLGNLNKDVRAYRLDIVRQLRTKGVSMRAIAKAAGVSSVAVTNWLKGDPKDAD